MSELNHLSLHDAIREIESLNHEMAAYEAALREAHNEPVLLRSRSPLSKVQTDGGDHDSTHNRANLSLIGAIAELNHEYAAYETGLLEQDTSVLGGSLELDRRTHTHYSNPPSPSSSQFDNDDLQTVLDDDEALHDILVALNREYSDYEASLVEEDSSVLQGHLDEMNRTTHVQHQSNVQESLIEKIAQLNREYATYEADMDTEDSSVLLQGHLKLDRDTHSHYDSDSDDDDSNIENQPQNSAYKSAGFNDSHHLESLILHLTELSREYDAYATSILPGGVHMKSLSSMSQVQPSLPPSLVSTPVLHLFDVDGIERSLTPPPMNLLSSDSTPRSRRMSIDDAPIHIAPRRHHRGHIPALTARSRVAFHDNNKLIGLRLMSYHFDSPPAYMLSC
jgi:hypothetical protein